MTYFMGIDPGKTGAVAVIDHELNKVHIFDTPTEVYKDAKKRTKLGYLEDVCYYLLKEACPEGLDKIRIAVVEHQQVMQKDGPNQAFMTGGGYYLWRGILCALQIPREYVRPADWKAKMLLGASKDLSRSRCAQLFPDVTPMLLRKLDHDRAEAALLAEYGRRLITKGGF